MGRRVAIACLMALLGAVAGEPVASAQSATSAVPKVPGATLMRPFHPDGYWLSLTVEILSSQEAEVCAHAIEYIGKRPHPARTINIWGCSIWRRGVHVDQVNWSGRLKGRLPTIQTDTRTRWKSDGWTVASKRTSRRREFIDIDVRWRPMGQVEPLAYVSALGVPILGVWLPFPILGVSRSVRWRGTLTFSDLGPRPVRLNRWGTARIWNGSPERLVRSATGV